MGRMRTSCRTTAVGGVLGLVIAIAVGGPISAAPSPPPAPPPAPKARLTDADVNRALDRLDAYVTAAMAKTGVPGVAVAVVHDDEVVRITGYGVRAAGRPEKVDADTVFRLASLSKPLSSTVVAGVLDKPERWDEHVDLPGFGLKDPWVSEHVTTADLFSHRSGLPDHAGDLLEDIGYDQGQILDRLRHLPLAPFRASYAYTNFGLTAAAEAVAREHGASWEKLAADTLFTPAGMTHTTVTTPAFRAEADRALPHVRGADGRWVPDDVRDPDAQAPAGGANSNARDLARWMRLQLNGGTLDGRRIIPADTLARTHLPEIVSRPPMTPDGGAGFYGLGWNVSYDDAGRLRLSHSGAFELGANTTVTLLPLERLGIVVLTNSAPVGLADAIALDFTDVAEHGRPTADWLAVAAYAYSQALDQGHSAIDWSRPPADPAPARPDSAYLGTYTNPYYGTLTVTSAGPDGALTLTLGPAERPHRFALTHRDGDVFGMDTRGENAIGRAAVTFTDRGTVRVEWLDADHLGTFTRS
ncbi:serine hydrolase [Streptomyces sp. BI20]|uniref:serine hydrolase n=1 Tax=Streptomyces sp. BI20 TaxID=3403460 RepID=UPI003C76E67F